MSEMISQVPPADLPNSVVSLLTRLGQEDEEQKRMPDRWWRLHKVFYDRQNAGQYIPSFILPLLHKLTSRKRSETWDVHDGDGNSVEFMMIPKVGLRRVSKITKSPGVLWSDANRLGSVVQNSLHVANSPTVAVGGKDLPATNIVFDVCFLSEGELDNLLPSQELHQLFVAPIGENGYRMTWRRQTI